ncbi:MAG TPA: DUF4349 domain-containing protein [Thermoanaerobaculia bacterium]|nr:DUF4349 domain-containing protein [Thermoanaerobaculia bacterium]
MRRILAWMLVLLAVAGCKKSESSPALRQGYAVNAAPPAPPAPPAPGADALTGTQAAPLRAASTPAPIRMIIRTAEVNLIVADTAVALEKLNAVVESNGGYLSGSKTWREGEQLRATLSVRVPANRLKATLAAVRTLAVRVQSESITGEDVTQEYVDLSARMRNLEAAEVELRQLLATVRQRTEKASEIMEVYEELTKIRGEIEQAKGRLQYLSQMTAYSTINLDLTPDALAKPIIEPGWQPRAIVREAFRALVATLEWLAGAGIWIVLYVLPIVLIFVVAVWLLVLIARGMIRRARQPKHE